RRQDYPLRWNAGSQNLDLGFEQPHLRIVSRHEKLGHEDQKEGKRRIHLAGHRCGPLKKCCSVNAIEYAYILAPLSGKPKKCKMDDRRQELPASWSVKPA